MDSTDRKFRKAPGGLHVAEIKQLLAHGYKIIPTRGKIPVINGWNTPEYLTTELVDTPKSTAIDRIARWDRRFNVAPTTIGVRIEDGLVAIDFDIDDGDMIDRMLLELARIAPNVHAKSPTRFGGGQIKIALFARLADGEELFVRRASRKYNKDEHCLEVFGGKKTKYGCCSRHFGVYGSHSFHDDGSVAFEYAWFEERPALHEVDIKDLPVITTEQITTLIDKFDALAVAAGWEPLKLQDVSAAGAIYDITDETRFDTSTGCIGITYDELCDEYEVYGEGLRCSANFMPGRGDSGKTDRCIVGDNNRHDCVAVFVFGDENLHFPAELAPPSLDQLSPLLKQLVATTPPSTFFNELDGALSQDSVAQIFAHRLKDQLRYCHHIGAWFRWAGTHWQREQTALAFDLCRKLSREVSRGSSMGAMKEARKVSFAGGVERFAKADRAFAVTSEIWDCDPFLLGTPGGTIDLRTGELRAADPADGITKLTAVAPADHADCCPRWMLFLDETFGDDANLIRFMRQWCGYCLTGDTREEALLFGFGNGKNGKSVWLNTIAGILHDYAVTAPMETFVASKWDRHPTELAMLRGARMVTATVVAPRAKFVKA